jgi:hypothetical protein
VSHSELDSVVAASVPLLEQALHDIEDDRFSPELQLRGSVCALATGALQQYVLGRHGTELERRLAVLDKAPRGMNGRILRHVGLFNGQKMIDPSYSQFFDYVGLDRLAARNDPRLASLYPETKVAVIDTGHSDDFADSIALKAQEIEETLAGMDDVARSTLPPLHSLTGKSLAEKKEMYRYIWNPGNYDLPFPIEGGEQSPSLTRRIGRVARRMTELEQSTN